MTNHSPILQMTKGFSSGYQYSRQRGAEDEIKKGKTYIYACPNQWGQLSRLTVVVGDVLNVFTQNTIVKTARIYIHYLPLLTLPFLAFSAIVQQGSYTDLYNSWNRTCTKEHLYPNAGIAARGMLLLFSLSNARYFIALSILVNLGTFLGFPLKAQDQFIEVGMHSINKIGRRLMNKTSLPKIAHSVQENVCTPLQNGCIRFCPTRIQTHMVTILNAAPFSKKQTFPLVKLSTLIFGLYITPFYRLIPLALFFGYRNYRNHHFIHPSVEQAVIKAQQMIKHIKVKTEPLYDSLITHIAAKGKLPKTLSPLVICMARRVAEHAGDFARIGLIISAATLCYFERYYYAVPMALAMGYQALKTNGLHLPVVEGTNRVYVPIKDYGKQWSLQRRNVIPLVVIAFTDRYLSSLSIIGYLISGGSSKILVFFHLKSLVDKVNPTYLYPLQRLFDRFLERFFKGPSLEGADAAISTYPNLPKDKIYELLKGEDRDYELSQAYCAKTSFENIQKDHTFEKLWSFFKKIPWSSRSRLVLLKLKNSERFRDFLAKKLGKTPDEIARNFDVHMQFYASKQKKDSDAVAIKWMEEEMRSYVDLLKGVIPFHGPAVDLSEAQQYSAMIIPYLENLTANQRIEREDILLKLALEGGDFCALGLKRASREIIFSAAAGLKAKGNASGKDEYEMDFFINFWTERQKRATDVYHNHPTLKKFRTLKARSADNIHVHDNQLTAFYGYLPFTAEQREKYGMNDVFYRKCFVGNALSELLNSTYDEAFNILGSSKRSTYFNQYILDFIRDNKSLRKEDQEAIKESFAGIGPNASTIHDFHRLFLYIIGAIQQKS